MGVQYCLYKWNIPYEIKSNEQDSKTTGELADTITNNFNILTFASLKQEIKRFESLNGTPFYDKLKKVEELFGDKKDHIVARKKLNNVLEIWQMMLREEMLLSFGRESNQMHNANYRRSKPTELLEVYAHTQLAREKLQQNIHPRLLLEKILLTIS